HCDSNIFDLDIPVLGICYGLQLIAHQLGGEVKPGKAREFGRAHLRAAANEGLFAGVPAATIVWMSHGDQVQPGGDFLPLASTDPAPPAAARHRTRPLYGLQFHPEVSHTPDGSRILRNFLYGVCGCTGSWKIGSFLEQTVAAIRQRVGTDRVICGLSGGVGSSVTAGLAAARPRRAAAPLPL